MSIVSEPTLVCSEAFGIAAPSHSFIDVGGSHLPTLALTALDAFSSTPSWICFYAPSFLPICPSVTRTNVPPDLLAVGYAPWALPLSASEYFSTLSLPKGHCLLFTLLLRERVYAACEMGRDS